MRKHGKRMSAGLTKGTPGSLVISLMIHAAAFMLAGVLVVIEVVKQDETIFVPPPAVERPKMKLRKPKVKVKNNTKPKQTKRIVAKMQRANMPDIKLPEMSGIGDGLAGGIGGFKIMPDFSELASPFGAKVTTGSELKGYFYNFNRNRNGVLRSMNPEAMTDILYSFMSRGWRASVFAPYFRSPDALYTPTICVPTVQSELAPAAFGMDGQEGYCWGVLYKGKIAYPEDIKFRFWGVGDKVLAVNVDGETVLICAYKNGDRARYAPIWQSNDPKDNTYYFGEHRARPSDWITLKAGEPKDIQVLLGDTNGGLVYHILSVEVEGQEYPLERGGGGPTFPVFKTTELSRDLQDVIYSNLYPGDTTLTNGPVFNDFASTKKAQPAPVADEVAVVAAEEAEPEADTGMRMWTNAKGKSFEAKFRAVVGQNVILENAKRKQLKLAWSDLTAEDRQYIEFANPPKFDINFIKKSEQVPNPPVSPWVGANQRPLQMFDFTFGTRVRQTSSGDYRHALTVEFFAVGEEVDGDNYVLLDRRTSTFTPTKENKRSHEFIGDAVRLMRIAYRDSAPVRGTKYGGYLVTITDENGKIVQHDASHDFLYEHFENLSQLRPNNHFNQECVRVMPARPTEDSRGPGAVNGN